jgi:hypothetical protein
MALIHKKEAQNAMKGLTTIRKELEKERARLKGSMKKLGKHAKSGTMPDWADEAMKLYHSPDYSFIKLMKLMRKNKLL